MFPVLPHKGESKDPSLSFNTIRILIFEKAFRVYFWPKKILSAGIYSLVQTMCPRPGSVQTANHGEKELWQQH